jgi:hypothetical protein
MSLKTKGFSRETEALILIGGGENRTLVLSKLPTHDYMLIALEIAIGLATRRPTSDRSALCKSRTPLPEGEKGVHIRVIDSRFNGPDRPLSCRQP